MLEAIVMGSLLGSIFNNLGVDYGFITFICCIILAVIIIKYRRCIQMPKKQKNDAQEDWERSHRLNMLYEDQEKLQKQLKKEV